MKLTLTTVVIAGVICCGLTKAQEAPPSEVNLAQDPSTSIRQHSVPQDASVDNLPRTVMVFPIADLIETLMSQESLDLETAQKVMVSQVESVAFFPSRQNALQDDTAEASAETTNQSHLKFFPENNSLVVKATKIEMQLISDYLEAIRTSGFCQVLTGFQVISSRVDLSETSQLKWKSLNKKSSFTEQTSQADSPSLTQPVSPTDRNGQHSGVMIAQVTDAELKKSISSLQQDHSTKKLFDSKITQLNGQHGGIDALSDPQMNAGFGSQKKEASSDANPFGKIGLQLHPSVSAGQSSVHLRASL